MMRDVLQRSAISFSEKHINTELFVLWESSSQQGDGNWLLNGLSDNYLHIGGLAETDRCNKIDRVKIQALTSDGLYGAIIL